MELLKTVQREEDSVTAAKREAEQLAQDVIRLGDDNMRLDKQLTDQEEKIRKVVNELENRNKEIKNLNDVNEQVKSGELKASDLDTQAKKSSEQLRMMAEKVFHLVNQLRKMDEWKSQASEDLKAAARKFQMLEKREEALQKALDKEDKTRHRMDTKVKDEREKATSFRLAAQEFRRKFIREERVRAKLMDAFKSKEKTLAEVLNKYKSVQWQLQNQKNSRENRRRRITELEAQAKDMLTATRVLRDKVRGLEKNQNHLQDIIRSKDQQIRNYRRRERQYVQKLSAYVETEKNAAVGALPGTIPTENGGNKSISDHELKELLSGKIGVKMLKMLEALGITQASFVDLARSPALLLRRVADRFTRSGVIRVPTKGSTLPKVVLTSVGQMNDRVNQTLDVRSRLVSRLMKWMSIEPPEQYDEEEQQKTLKQLGAVLSNSLTFLDLSECELGDFECDVIAQHLPVCQPLLILDMKKNRISDEAFFAVGKALVNVER